MIARAARALLPSAAAGLAALAVTWLLRGTADLTLAIALFAAFAAAAVVREWLRGPRRAPEYRGRWMSLPARVYRSGGAAPGSRGRGRPEPIGPFDRFDEEGKRALALAQDEALRMSHTYIGTEHLLLGIARGGHGAGARALADSGLTVDRLREVVRFSLSDPATAPPTGPAEMTLSPRAKRAIELAVDEARRLSHARVGSGHLLLGLLAEGQGMAMGFVESLGVGRDALERRVRELLAES